jgi:hypothetical protein
MSINFANVQVGTTAGDGTGDPLRLAFTKINLNFANIAGGDLDAGNVAYTPANISNWNYAVYTVSQALDQVVAQSNSTQTATYLTTYSGNISAGNLTVYGTSKFGTHTVNNLPSASAVGVGVRSFVTDANISATAVGTPISSITGGFGNSLPVYSDGSIWRIG